MHSWAVAGWVLWWNSCPDVIISLFIHYFHHEDTSDQQQNNSAPRLSNWAHWFQIKPNDGQAAGRILHYQSLDAGPNLTVRVIINGTEACITNYMLLIDALITTVKHAICYLTLNFCLTSVS